jgi:protein-L-isoaspartate O-methyltransferase
VGQPAIVDATLSVDRALFVPDLVWLPEAEGYRAVSRAEEPEAWTAAVAADEPVVTQVDDGATLPGAFGQRASSSSSKPSIVAAMLAAAHLTPETRVLEIGTGTGWFSALLSDRLGSDAVTTLDVDPAVTEEAGAALRRAGFAPMVVTADGAAGYPPGAPYDRVIATCAVTHVPYAWVEQTRPAGLVLTPWATDYHNGALARLTVYANGEASGYFVPEDLAFMRLRAQRRPVCPWDGEEEPGDPQLSFTAVSSRQVYEMITGAGAFAAGLFMPQCHKVIDENNLVVRLHDPDSGSWARCDVVRGDGPHGVAQYGARRLWDDLVRVYSWWVTRDRPAIDRFGLTVTRAGYQHVWLDRASNVVR